MIMLALAETFSMAVKAGIDPLDLWGALRLGLVGRRSPLDMLTSQVLPGDTSPQHSRSSSPTRTWPSATMLGRELGVPMRLANLTMEEMTEALGPRSKRPGLTVVPEAPAPAPACRRGDRRRPRPAATSDRGTGDVDANREGACDVRNLTNG